MSIDGIVTIGVITSMFLFLMFEWIKPHYALLGALAILLSLGIVTPFETLYGFVNPSVLTIAVLFMVVGSIHQSNLLKLLGNAILRSAGNQSRLTIRLMMITSGFSAFLNNTPLVLLLTPIIKRWGVLHNVPPSKLLISLSYGAILGGMCTLIGTSTNLIIHALLIQNGYDGFTMLELSLVGLPCVVGGTLYMGLIGYKYLPEIPSSRLDQEEIMNQEPEELKYSLREFFPYFIFIVLIICVSLKFVTMLIGALATSLLFLVTRVMTVKQTVQLIPWSLLVVIGSALGLAKALEQSGAGYFLMQEFVLPISQFGAFPLLVVLYLMTSLLTELITNNAAAVFVFPMALVLTEQLSLNIEPFAVGIAVAASASFATPIGYQTNLIVYEAGDYHFKHFLITGIPLKMIVMAISLFIIPIYWPFR